MNVASASELSQLSGIGDARAKAIIGGRPYASVDDVRRVIPQVFAQVRDCFVVEKVNINAASAAELVAKLPGIGQARATAIVSGRPYQAPEDLVQKRILTQSVFDGIKPLVTTR